MREEVSRPRSISEEYVAAIFRMRLARRSGPKPIELSHKDLPDNSSRTSRRDFCASAAYGEHPAREELARIAASIKGAMAK